MKALCTFLILIQCCSVYGQDMEAVQARKIIFPDIEGYQTLICDLHQHTVFSDGAVWPSIRVREAIRDGLNAIAVTEHLEYQPHSSDIPHPDRNRAFQIESDLADGEELLIIPGSEITRSMPPGHANAIFIEDANKLLDEDYLKVFKEAKDQGAFIFWNHPDWPDQVSDGIARLSDEHRKLIEQKMLHGIEVVNMHTFSKEALRICLEENLTILGTSDIHGLIDWDYPVWFGGHRPVTMVFAEAKSIESIKEALFAGRTVVWFKNTLIGKVENITPLLDASMKVTGVRYMGKTSILEVVIQNYSDANFILENLSEFSLQRHPDLIELPAHGEVTVRLKTKQQLTGNLEWEVKVRNTVIAPDKNANYIFKLTIP